MPEGMFCRRCKKLSPRPICRKCEQEEMNERLDANRYVKAPKENVYLTRDWKRVAAFVRARDGGCVVCGTNFRVAVHHLHPKRLGGPDEPWNLISLCASHHAQLEADLRTRRDTDLRRLVADLATALKQESY